MPATDEMAINAVRQGFLEGYNKGDAAGLAACGSDDIVQLPPNEATVRGKEPIEARYRAQFDRFACDLSTMTEELQISDQWAFAWGTYKITLNPRDGAATIRDNGKYIAIFRWECDGSRKFARDTFNSDNPTPTAA
jgi:ketosteroid isomerase-like protein